MNCRRVEKLIPLYVEGDLVSGAAERLASHLEWCGRCNWLADEYKDSQSWLRSSEPPAFDEASLNGLKAGVLRRIAESTAKPSLLASLMQQWTRRQVFALSTALLIILGMVVLYVYQTRARTSAPLPIRTESNPGVEVGTQDSVYLTARVDKAPGAGSNKRHHLSRRHTALKAHYVSPTIAERAPAPVETQADAATEPVAVVSNNTDTGAVGLPAPLRIEIQTSDPNIRIIWFAPRETDPHQTKPATD